MYTKGTQMKIILASQSPRRKEFLEKMGIEFEVCPSEFEEVKPDNIDIEQTALYFACQKAQDVFDRTKGDRVVIGCDTTVVVGDNIYGKPKDNHDAFDMLKSYVNNYNKVISGLCVLVQKNDKVTKHTANEITKVFVGDMSDKEIMDYVLTGEPFDKAGAYALQGKYNIFIDKVEGNVSSVIGLPTNKLLEIFRKENIKYFDFKNKGEMK